MGHIFPNVWSGHVNFTLNDDVVVYTPTNRTTYMAGPSKSEILAMFAELDGKPDRHGYGDPFQYPAYEWLAIKEKQYGDAMLEPLQDAISETTHQHAARSGILFLGQMRGSVRFLTDIAVNHPNRKYRITAVEALELLGDVETLRSICNTVPPEDRKFVARTVVFMDVEASGGYGSLAWTLLLGRHPGKHWDESKSRFGEAKTRETVIMVRDHPQLYEGVRSVVSKICSELLHDG